MRADTVHKIGGFTVSIDTGGELEFFARILAHGKWGHVQDCSIRRLCQNDTLYLGTMDDRLRRLAHIFEDCIENFRFKEHISYRTIKREMARHWYNAGKSLLPYKRYVEAEECFRRSLSWKFFRNTSWSYIISMYRKKYIR